jgi:hypothetical protein
LQTTRRFWVIPAILFASTTAACAPPPGALLPAPGDTRAAIDAQDLRLRIGILAHDSLRGRETGTPQIESAARYLAGEMERLGLRPAGDNGSYYQSVPLERRRVSAEISVSAPAGVLAPGVEQVLPVSGLGGLPPPGRFDGAGAILYGGHLVDPSIGDAEIALDELRDAAVIVRLGLPEGVGQAAMPRMTLASLFSPTSPAAALLLVAEETEADFWEYATEISQKGAISLAGARPRGPGSPPVFLISSAFAERLLGGPLGQARLPQSGLGTFRYVLRESAEPVEAWNVVAVLPGADQARAGEFVALGAHYDHVGVGPPLNGDSIYNGADDNASGTTALLEIAEAFAHSPPGQRPARSVLFAWKTAEEAGLLGSEHFTDHPTVPREAIVAHVNLDMVGRNHPDSLMVIGPRRLSTELGELVEAVNRRQPQPFVFDYSYDVPGHPEQLFCRSDHYNYARYGIPIVFLTTGLHEDYHAPSDRPERIDYEKLARVSRLVFDLTLEVASRPAPPVVDQPVPPLGAPCS